MHEVPSSNSECLPGDSSCFGGLERMRSGDGDCRAELIWFGLTVRILDVERGIYVTERADSSIRFEVFLRPMSDRDRSVDDTT